MAKEKAPAFQFYPKDFLSDGNVSGMSLQERGAYITLLCFCWNDGSLPVEIPRLARMLGTPEKAFLKFWPAVRACFVEQDCRYLHPRLEKEREKQASHRQRASDKGTNGAAARWHRHSAGNAQAMPSDGSALSDLQSPISISSGRRSVIR